MYDCLILNSRQEKTSGDGQGEGHSVLHDLKRGLVSRVQLPLPLQLPLHVRKIQARSHSAVNVDDPAPAESQQNGQCLSAFQSGAFRLDAMGRRARGGGREGEGVTGREGSEGKGRGM